MSSSAAAAACFASITPGTACAARLELALGFFDTVVIVDSTFLLPLIVVLRRTIRKVIVDSTVVIVDSTFLTSRRVASRRERKRTQAHASTKRSVLSIIVSIDPS